MRMPVEALTVHTPAPRKTPQGRGTQVNLEEILLRHTSQLSLEFLGQDAVNCVGACCSSACAQDCSSCTRALSSLACPVGQLPPHSNGQIRSVNHKAENTRLGRIHPASSAVHYGQWTCFVSPEETWTSCSEQFPTTTLYNPGETTKVTSVTSVLGCELMMILAPGGVDVMTSLPGRAGICNSIAGVSRRYKKNMISRAGDLGWMFILILRAHILIHKARK